MKNIFTIYLESDEICGNIKDAGQCSKAGEKVSKTIWQSSILWPRAQKKIKKTRWQNPQKDLFLKPWKHY